MAVGLNGQALGTVGVELEGTGLDRNVVSSTIAAHINNRFQKYGNVVTVGRDASVEFKAEFMRSIHKNPLINLHTKMSKKISGLNYDSSYQRVMGYELITSPLEISLLEPVIYESSMRLLSAGDYGSKRASTHFHIGFPHNFRMLKNLLRMSLTLDPILFRLGGMGGSFRGDSNQACYARPLMNSAAVPLKNRPQTGEELAFEHARRQLRRAIAQQGVSAVPRSLREETEEETLLEGDYPYVQIINPAAALEANSIEEFWASFGVNYQNPNGVKYHPMRYSGINFFALPSHGTIEFRHANYTRNPELIVALAKFLRAATELAALMTKSEVFRLEPLNPNEEVSISDGVQVLSMLLEMSREKEIEDLPDDNEMALLFDVLANSSFSPLPETPVKTHIRDFAISTNLAGLGKLKPVRKPLEPNHVDIHTIKYQSIFE